MVLIGGKAAWANITSAIDDFDGRLTIEDPSTVGNSSQQIDADGQSVGYFFDITITGASGLQDAVRMFSALNGAGFPNWILTLAMNDHKQIEPYFDDATGWHGFLDQEGTVVTFSDPKGGGGTISIGINSYGQIVGNVYDWKRGRGLPDMPRLSEASEPKALPFLAGCLPFVVVMALRRKRKR
jgi:hypothetical protein